MEKIKANPGSMRLDDLFRLRTDRVARFAEAQVHLYRHNVSLQDYFHALDFNMFYDQNNVCYNPPSVNPLALWLFRAANSTSRIFKPRRIKTDVLFCPTPYFGRKTEVQFLIRTLLGLGQTGAEIVCLLPTHAPFRKELDAQLEAAGYFKQIRFLDPGIPYSPIEGQFRVVAAKLRGRAAFDETVQILEPYGLSPTSSALPDFQRAALYVEGWERLMESIEFDAVVSRCHWYDLCSSVCRSGLDRGKPVITFQQGVVDYTSDIPIVASKFVSFGASSSSVLAELNSRFFEAVGSPEPPIEFFPAGSLFDVLPSLSDQFALQTVLLIDAYPVPGDPWAMNRELQALMELAERLLTADLTLQRLIIRPHPQWSDFDLTAALELVRKHRNRCELSHPVWSLEEDMRRASVVVGISSGVLTAASASGLPTIFLRTEQGYSIRDLECFSPEQTLLPDEAFRVSKLLVHSESYAEAREGSPAQFE